MKNVPFSPLNTGTGFGVLRFIDGKDLRPATAKDVVIFARVPNDLAHTAGVITLDPQTPLSHVNLKAKQNNTPNAYIKDADQLADVKKLLGSVVRFEVTDTGFTLRAATAAEASDHMESLRPTQKTTPPRDLSKTKPASLATLSHHDLAAFGAKSVNAAETMKVLPPEACIAGTAVPFAFYDSFMKSSGLYDKATAMLQEPRFQSDETFRNNQLKKFRRLLRDTPLPPALQQQVKDVEKGLPPGTTLRLRSSTNNEDLAGFNGAGLYSSRTWEPNAPKTSQKQDFGAVMKDVWSSLWSFRAVEERTFHRIDHLATAMGVLVHPSYESDGAAGVAVTKNIYDPHGPGLYVNVQPKLGSSSAMRRSGRESDGTPTEKRSLARNALTGNLARRWSPRRPLPGPLAPRVPWAARAGNQTALQRKSDRSRATRSRGILPDSLISPSHSKRQGDGWPPTDVARRPGSGRDETKGVIDAGRCPQGSDGRAPAIPRRRCRGS